MATKKEFILNVTQELQANPRAILAGHRIQGGMLQKIVNRPDIMSKLAAALYTTKYARKGAKGLRKASNFGIKVYKNFPTFNAQARIDVEAFIEGLDEKDQNSFSNNDNIVTFIALPDADVTNDVENLESDIVSGKSIGLQFDSAVKKEYKVPGGFYVIVMIADSAVRPAEGNVSKRTEKRAAKKQIKRTPARIKAELKAKASKKLGKIDSELQKLNAQKFKLENQIAQFKNAAAQIGVKGGLPTTLGWRAQKALSNNAPINSKAEFDAAVNSLPKEAQEDIIAAIRLAKRGKVQAAKVLLKGVILSDDIKAIVTEGVMNPDKFTTPDKKLAARKKALKQRIVALTTKNEALLTELPTAEGGRKNSIRSMISKNSAEIKKLRASLGTYKNLSSTALKNKARMLKEVNKNIEKNLQLGNSIKQSLNNAIAALDATPAQKQVIKQQVVQQVVSGVPLQYATQQAIQNLDMPADGGQQMGQQTVQQVLAGLGNGQQTVQQVAAPAQQRMQVGKQKTVQQVLASLGGGQQVSAPVGGNQRRQQQVIEEIADETFVDDEEEIGTTLLTGSKSLQDIIAAL